MASFCFGIGRLALVISVNPLTSELTLFLGMRNEVLDWPWCFLNARYQQCFVHEQINTAYRTDIFQRDGSFCDENCRSWMDIEWNQLEIGEFSSDSAKASGCRSTPTVGPTCLLQVVVPKTCGTRQSVLHRLPKWALLCGQRSCCFHETCQKKKCILLISCVFWMIDC